MLRSLAALATARAAAALSCVAAVVLVGCATQNASAPALALPAAYPAKVRLQPAVSRELVESIAGGVLTERLDANVADMIVDAAGVWRIGLQPVGVEGDEARWWLTVDGANSLAASGGWATATATEGPPLTGPTTPRSAGRLEPPFRERDRVTLVRFARWDAALDLVRESVIVTRRVALGPTDSDPEYIGVAPSEPNETAAVGDDVLLAFGEAPAPTALLDALPADAHVSPSTDLVYLEARRDTRSCLRLTEHFRFLLGAPPEAPAGLRPSTSVSGPALQKLSTAPTTGATRRPVAPGESAEVRSGRHLWVFRAIELSSPAEEDTCQPPAGRRSAWLLVHVGADAAEDGAP